MAAAALVLPPTTAPEGYHRIVSPTLTIPHDTNVSIPVGLLACQRDPLLRCLATRVVKASKPESKAQQPAKKNKKASDPASTVTPVLQIILHDTIIFPEGGGQPSDIGFIATSNGDLCWEVKEAKRVGGNAIHFVQLRSDMDVEAALKLFSPGVEVTVSLGEEGFKRRLDHMTLHTSQHLLSAVLEQQLGLPTLSWSLTSYPSPCYVELPRGMTSEEITSIQEESNRLVFEGRKVHVEVEELHAENTPGVAVLESGRAAGKALPSDYTGGVKRIVIIDGVDRNPCCGTHMPTLHNLQLFLIPHTEALSRSSTTSARLYFLAGPRLITYLSKTNSFLTNASSVLSCGAPQVPERISQVIDERKKAEKRVDDLEAELAGFISRKFTQQAVDQQSDVKDKLFAIHSHRNDDTLGFLSAIGTSFTSEWSSSSSASRPFIVVLTSSPTSQTTTSTSLVVIFGSDDKTVKEVGDAVKSKVGVKGGGKGNKWSGKIIGVWKDSKESAIIDELLERLCNQ